MNIKSYLSTKNNGQEAIAEIISAIKADTTAAPSWLYIAYTCTHNPQLIASALSKSYPHTPLHGTTSCHGVMTQQGHAGVDGFAMAVLALWDEAGSYGSAACEYSADIEDSVHVAIRSAMLQAGREGEAPAAVWLHAAPGQEEQTLEAIGKMIGKNVPVLGGSSGDNTLSAEWSQIANQSVYKNALSLSLLYPSSPISYQFHSGYKPTANEGIVTRCDGHIVYEIDNRPAATVYNEWTGGILDACMGQDRAILSITTLFPLGRVAGDINGIAQYKLSHPESIRKDGGIRVFTRIKEGEQLNLMSGTIDSLVTRAGRVVNSAIELSGMGKDDIQGALLIYCAGCLLTVNDQIHAVSRGVNEALAHQPFVGAYTLGEQGCFEEGVNIHGNLMISALIFYESEYDTKPG